MQSRRAEEMISGIEVALHDLCQPLTVLQCKLELEPLEWQRRGDTCCVWWDGLHECRRLNAVVKTMRELVPRDRFSWKGHGDEMAAGIECDGYVDDADGGVGECGCGVATEAAGFADWAAVAGERGGAEARRRWRFWRSLDQRRCWWIAGFRIWRWVSLRDRFGRCIRANGTAAGGWGDGEWWWR